MSRVKSDIWVSAWLRSVSAAGAMALVVRKGAADGGAIAVKVNRLDGSFDLYLPAPQSFYEDADSADRPFEKVLEAVPEQEADQRLASEIRFDQDLWVLECEDRLGRNFIP